MPKAAPKPGVKANAQLRIKRKECKLTLEQVAEKVGVTPSAVAQWEKGIVNVSLGRLRRLAGIYKCSVAELTDDPHDDPAPEGLAAIIGKLTSDEAKRVYEFAEDVLFARGRKR